MAMVVKNNMSAVRTLGTLNRNSEALAKSLERVSSGQKLNSAADDNSGYSISERMRVRIRSLDQADQNTQNGASMLKVAGGAVDSTVEILRTMKEKAINAANDSNTDSDRATIQKELDQSIDQVDDNALVTYNGKYLVDGSKMFKGVSTRTTLTNNSLSTDTKGSTALVDLKDRNGNNLNIQTTDTLTISYVIQGRTYSKDVDIDASTTLKSALDEAAKPFRENSPIGSQIERVYNSSINLADSTYNSSMDAALVNYNGSMMTSRQALAAAQRAVDSAQANLDAANRVLTSAVNTWNAGTGGHLTTANFGTGGATASTYFNSSGTAYDLNAVSATAAFPITGADIVNNVNAADQAYRNAVSARDTAQQRVDADHAIYNPIKVSSENSAEVVRDSSYASAEVALGEALGDLLPYKRLLGETDVIGKDAAGDTVYTADRKNAITITAASAGTSHQISGITFRVSDSKGQVKKSVNAVLDNFNESIRSVNKSNDNAITLQVGDKANVSIRVGLTDMRSEALGLKSSTGETISVGNQTNANAAINVLDNAIQKALNQQTDIGAVSSRMEQTSNNLHIARDNVQASESVIRDADMAKEMTEYTRNNVLLQAAQSMLAQANQNSSSVLGLLQ